MAAEAKRPRLLLSSFNRPMAVIGISPRRNQACDNHHAANRKCRRSRLISGALSSTLSWQYQLSIAGINHEILKGIIMAKCRGGNARRINHRRGPKAETRASISRSFIFRVAANHGEMPKINSAASNRRPGGRSRKSGEAPAINVGRYLSSGIVASARARRLHISKPCLSKRRQKCAAKSRGHRRQL